MLKKLLILCVAITVAATAFAAPLPKEEPLHKGIERDIQRYQSGEELIYRAYTHLIVWVLTNGQFSQNADGSRMKYIRLREILQAPIQPVELQGIPFGPPKVRKVYFQVVVKATTSAPASPDDIEACVRIVIVDTTKHETHLEASYYVATDSTILGLPNTIKEWTAYKESNGKVTSRTEAKVPDVPESAEIIDMTWGKWLAEFIKIYQSQLTESFPDDWSWDGPELRNIIYKELAYENQESASSSGFNPNLADPDLWIR